MYLYYICFFKNQNWNIERITCYLHARNLNNKCEPEIIEDKENKFYKVYFMNEETTKQKTEDIKLYTLKYMLDDAIYCFFQIKANEEQSVIKHELI
jgi:hypothetical protein